MEREVKTYRGRTLDELLPQIRAELGPDAIILRRREGLTGGIAGFFQRPFVEVEASGPAAAEGARAPVRNDQATADGLASPAIRQLVDQASPFADELQAAQQRDRSAAERAADLLGANGAAAAAAESPGLYGPQPNVAPPEPAPPAAEPAPPAEPAPDLREPLPQRERRDWDDPTGAGAPAGRGAPADDEDDEPVAPPPTFERPSRPAPTPPPPRDPAPTAEPAGGDGDDRLPAPSRSTALMAPRPAAATTAERRLMLSGLDSGLAADIVGEAVTHGIPFSSARSLKKLVRMSLAQRIPVLSGRGPRARSLAFVGASGSGKTEAAGHLAAAYARADTLPVLAVSLRPRDGGAELRERLAPYGVPVHAAADGEEAKRALEVARGAMVVVDTPAFSIRDRDAISALALDLDRLDLGEVHLALPATMSGASAAELARSLEEVGLTHVALTRMDETEHPGAPIGFCITSGGPISYLCEHESILPADPVALAHRLLP